MTVQIKLLEMCLDSVPLFLYLFHVISPYFSYNRLMRVCMADWNLRFGYQLQSVGGGFSAISSFINERLL